MLTANPNVALILIVEDDNNHAELIQRSFEEAPDEYRLEFVGTICDAKSAMELNPPGLVLTDYRLPDGDGSELVMIAAGLMPVIIMTSHGSEQVAVEAMKIGAQDYIVKSSETFESLPIAVKYGLITWALTSARKQAAAAALRAKKDWERTFDAVPDLISIVDLNHVIIRANKAMADGCGLTQDELSKRVGKNRSTVTNYMRLLKLPAEVQAAIRDGSIGMAHARALVNIEGEAKQLVITRKIIAEGLSVRDVEKLARQLNKVLTPLTKSGKVALPLKYEVIKDSIQERLNRKVEINRTPKGKGNIVIPFISDEDLQTIVSKLGI